MPPVELVQKIKAFRDEKQARVDQMKDPPWYWFGYWLGITSYNDKINDVETFIDEHISQVSGDVTKHKNKILAIRKNVKICEGYIRQKACDLPGGRKVPTQEQAQLALGTITTMLGFDPRLDLCL